MAGYLHDWYNPVNAERNEIVFANRHREYGAYQIRKHYNMRILLSLALASGLVILSFSAPMIIRLISKAGIEKMKLISEVLGGIRCISKCPLIK